MQNIKFLSIPLLLSTLSLYSADTQKLRAAALHQPKTAALPNIKKKDPNSPHSTPTPTRRLLSSSTQQLHPLENHLTVRRAASLRLWQQSWTTPATWRRWGFHV